jgi:hypothetical protein
MVCDSGDRLCQGSVAIELTVVSWRGDFCKLEGKATIDGQLATEATLMCKMVDREFVKKAEEPAK